MSEKAPRRVHSSIDNLPEKMRVELDRRLMDNRITLTELTTWLKEEGYPISRSAIHRHSQYNAAVAKRVSDSLIQAQAIAQAVAAHPDLDYTSAAQAVLMRGLMERVSTAEEEFDELPLDKVGRLIASLARNATYEKRVRAELKKKAELAFEELETELLAEIKQYPELVADLHEVLARAKEKVLADENS